MPELFPDTTSFIISAVVMLGAQLIYATVGFGAGMFSVALLALVLPDLAGVVATLLILTCVTEVWVLARNWRQAQFKLVLIALPTTFAGLWLGTLWLAGGNVDWLKRALGLVVLLSGSWFLYTELGKRTPVAVPSSTTQRTSGPRLLWTIPVGFIAGVLGGLFGTGGPPIIVFLKSCRLPKGVFRATLLCYFLTMTGLRGITYVNEGLLTAQVLLAAAWLLPSSMVGALLGMMLHDRLSERRFALGVSGVLILAGGVLILRGS